ncbi:MAG TPA: class I SAM-dependent methyltransferase [Streptosporangiaceae bacterium]
MAGQWNHNLHYHPFILDRVPEGCGRALDVGCGRGLLAGQLAGRCRAVVGLDRDPAILEAAVPGPGRTPGLRLLCADVLDRPFTPASFDFISAVASVHHMDFGSALAALAGLLRPGGTLIIIGLARDRSPADWAVSAAAMPVHWACQWRSRPGGRGPAVARGPEPRVLPPTVSWAQVRAGARATLPGCRYRRHLWRYSVCWRKPETEARHE